MSPKTPRINAAEVIQKLKRAGFLEASQSGSHLKLFNPVTRRIAIVPVHAGKTLPIGTLKSIEKQSGVQFGG